MEGHTAAAVLPSARVEWAVATRGTQECRLVRAGQTPTASNVHEPALQAL